LRLAHGVRLAASQRASHHPRQKLSHVEAGLDRIAVKLGEMHAIPLQARGCHQRVHARLRRAMAVITVSGLVGFLAGLSRRLIGKT
jgi:hypothetical protein